MARRLHRRMVTKEALRMAKNDRKLALKKETLRNISVDRLRYVAGGLATGYLACLGAEESGKCGSTTSMIDGDIIIRYG